MDPAALVDAAAMDLVNGLVGDAEDQAVPVALAARDLADLPVVAAVVVPMVKDAVLRGAHLVAAPAVLVVVVLKVGLPVEDVPDLTPSEC